MLRYVIIALGLALVSISGASAGQWLYTADGLPSAAGWHVYGSSSYENGGGVTSDISDGAWRLVDASSASQCLMRETSLGDVSFNTGISYAARMRCESASADSSYMLGVSNGNVGGMFLRLNTNQLSLVDLAGNSRGSHSLDGSVYHTYQLTVRNATQGDNSTAVWRIYVDGAQVITWTGAGTDAGFDGFMAGHGGATGTGVWYFDAIAARNDGAYSPSEWSPITTDPPPTGVKQGWVLLRDEPISCYQELLSHAPEYHVNLVQISHSIMMYTWEPLTDPTRRDKIRQIASLAHSNGVDEVVCWVHDIQDNSHWRVPSVYKTPDGKIDLDQEAFWNWLAGTYVQFFDACPEVDGVVLTLTENFVYGGADVYDRTRVRHTGRTPEDSCLKLIQTIWNVCKQRGKSMYVRTWTLYGGADTWIRNAIIRTNEPDIWMMSKATGAGDWDVIQEPYDIIGTCTGHPELLEFDVTGEYWGYTWTPWSGVDYIKNLWTNFALPRGADGMVARIDREDQSSAPGIHPRAIETPNRINLYALDVLANYPGTSVDSIYDYFCSHWFGAAASDRVKSALKRSFDISNACYNLPKPSANPDYSFSDSVAREECLASLFDIDCVNASLKASANFQPSSGLSNYDILRDPFERAAAKLGLAIPRTLFGDFAAVSQPDGHAECSVRLVDAAMGFSPGSLSVRYSSDGGSTWQNYANPVITASGGATDPYLVSLASVPFASAAAGRNKVRFQVAYPGGSSDTRDFTVKSADEAWITLGSAITGDGIAHPQPQNGDGDTVAASAAGRSCRKSSTASDTSFYFHVDDGFCSGGSTSTLYLQVDYYGVSGSITPVYDGRLRTDETLAPIYLNGSAAWRTTTRKLDDVNFGNRLTSGADLRLYVGTGANVYISGVRLYETPPQGMLAQPEGLSAVATSPTETALTWQAVPGASKYQVCRGSTCVGWATGTTFADHGLTANTQYVYTVTAWDGANFTSPTSKARVITTLPNQQTVRASRAAGEWSTSPLLMLTLSGNFGWGTLGYYRYAFDESPTHTWTGSELAWPSGIEPPAGWSAWRADTSPIDPGSGWLLYDGSTTQRCISDEMVTDAEGSAWRLIDQGRVVNTKAKLALWPVLPVDRGQGITVCARIKASDSPMGWADTGANFGILTLDGPDAGVTIRPDYLGLSGPDSDSGFSAPDIGYSYHTYTMTLKNRSYEVYKDGKLCLAVDSDTTANNMWSGPFFGHTRSNAVGAWSFRWVAWKNGYYPPSAWTAPLLLTTPHYGSSFYVHLKPMNADGLSNGSTRLGPFYYWDGSTPVAPSVTDDGSYTTANAIHASYTPAAPSLNRYECAIGTSPGAEDVLPFTSNGLALELTRTGLTLAEGPKYYISVRGVSGATGPAGTSNGVRVAPRYESIAHAKALPDGSPAALYAKVVSAVFADCVYVQEPRGPGLRVITSKPLSVGDTVDLAGVLSGAGGERTLIADAVFVNSGL